MLATRSLTKKFGAFTALSAVDIDLPPATVLGVIGLNGAGKTTLIRILLGMVRTTSGEVHLFGAPLSRDRSVWHRVGYLVETPFPYPGLSVRENLRVHQLLHGTRDARALDQMIERLKLGAYADIRAEHLSLGNRQRLGLAKALLHRPELLILDEPINGLDPEGIIEVRNLLLELAEQGSSILLSSHILGEVSKVAHQLAILHQGRIVEALSASELPTRLHKQLRVHTSDDAAALGVLHSLGHSAIAVGGGIELTDAQAISDPARVNRTLMEHGLVPQDLHVHEEDLEHYFLRLISTPKA